MVFQVSFMVFHGFCLVLPKAMCATSPYLVTLRPELALMSNIRANLSSWRSTCPHLQIIASYFDNNVMNDNERKTMRCNINYNFFLPTKYPLQLWKHWECWVDCCCYVSLSWQKVVCSCFVLLAWSCVVHIRLALWVRPVAGSESLTQIFLIDLLLPRSAEE